MEELVTELKGLSSDFSGEEDEMVEYENLDSEVTDVNKKDGKCSRANGGLNLTVDGCIGGKGRNTVMASGLDKNVLSSKKCSRLNNASKKVCGAIGKPSEEDAKNEMAVLDVYKKCSDGKESSFSEPVDCQMNSSDVSIPCIKDAIGFQKGTNMSHEEVLFNKDDLKGEEVESNEIKNCDNDGELMDINPVTVEEIGSHKRKRDSLWRTLCWINGIAKNPCDSEVGSLPDRSKWKCFGNEYWKQVLLAREAMSSKLHVNSSTEQTSWQRNQRMRPSMYDDPNGSGYKKRLRCRESLFFKKKASVEGASSKSPSRFQSALDKSDGKKKYLDKQSSKNSELSTEELIFEDYARQKVPLGPSFQAVVPEWTGLVTESDSKWLGTRVWPLEKAEKKYVVERDPIGKGRQNSCGCQFQGSTDCIRFHIAQKRLKLRRELGSAFNKWMFDDMGEEVRRSWTEDEEKRFSAVVKANPPSLQKSFWDEIFNSFPSKSRGDLISYYYNVFVLQRRGYQNRVTPNDINSDDDDEAAWDIEVLVPGMGKS